MVDRVGAASLQDIQRQRAEWQRDATSALATGETATAIDAYARNGHLHAAQTRDEAARLLIRQWSDDLRSRTGLPDLILAPTRKDVALLNQAARNMMQSHDRLGASRRVRAVEEAISKRDRSIDTRVPVQGLLFTPVFTPGAG